MLQAGGALHHAAVARIQAYWRRYTVCNLRHTVHNVDHEVPTCRLLVAARQTVRHDEKPPKMQV